jgi:hypothetical protein
MRETPLSPFVRIVEFCTRYPWRVLISAAVIAAAAGFYAADRFAITTNVNYLLSSGLPSRDRGGGRRADARAGGAGGGAPHGAACWTAGSGVATFETCRRLPRMSVHWRTPEVTGEPRELRD